MSHDYRDKPPKSQEKCEAKKRYARHIGDVVYFVLGGLCYLAVRSVAPWWVAAAAIIGFSRHITFVAEAIAAFITRSLGVSQEEESSTEIIRRSEGAALVPYLENRWSFGGHDSKWLIPRVDPEGIEARQAHGTRKRIPWSEVEECVVVRRLNFKGEARAEILINGQSGTLLRLTDVRFYDTLLVSAIRFYLRGEEAPQVLGGSQ